MILFPLLVLIVNLFRSVFVLSESPNLHCQKEVDSASVASNSKNREDRSGEMSMELKEEKSDG
jgi:hypothetical protein